MASGRTVQVTWDWAAGRKVPVSDDLKTRIEAFQAAAAQELPAPGPPGYWILTRPENPSSYPW